MISFLIASSSSYLEIIIWISSHLHYYRIFLSTFCIIISLHYYPISIWIHPHLLTHHRCCRNNQMLHLHFTTILPPPCLKQPSGTKSSRCIQNYSHQLSRISSQSTTWPHFSPPSCTSVTQQSSNVDLAYHLHWGQAFWRTAPINFKNHHD